MLTEIKDLKIEMLKVHTIFVPLMELKLFAKCRKIFLGLTQERPCFYINSQSVCNGIKGTTFTLNTNAIINLTDNEDGLIKDMLYVCQEMADITGKTIFYQVKTVEDTIKSFKISPEIQCRTQ